MNARTFAQPPQAEPDNIDLSTLVTQIWRRKWWIVLAVVLGLGVAFIAVKQVATKYTSRATVMLDPRELQILDSGEVVSELKLSASVMDTEVSVLRSNTLLEKVVAAFPAETFEAYDPANTPPSTFGRVRNWIAGPTPRVDGDDAENTRVTRSREEIEAARVRRLVNAIRRDLLVWRDGQSYIIAISVTTEDPALSATIANGIVDAYLASQIALRSDILQKVTDFLAGQANELRRELEAAETAIEEFRRTQLSEIGVTAGTLERQLAELSTQLAIARSDLAIANSRLQQIMSVIQLEGIEVASELLSSPLVQSLRQQLFDLRRTDANLALQFGQGHPERQALNASIQETNAALEAEVSAVLANLNNEVEVGKIRAETLRTNMLEFEERSAELSRASLQLRQLEREATSVRSNFEAVLDRLNETRSIQQLQRADARIVERAQASRMPSEPRVMLFTALGGTVGFLLGLSLVALRVLSNDSVMRPAELEAAVGVKVAATVPKETWKSLPQMLASMKMHPTRVFSERIRLLRTSLNLRSIKTLMVTSALPNEGKSSIAVALAYAETQARRKCVVVEFDWRRCTIAKKLSYQPLIGDLNGVLQNMCSVSDAVFQVPNYGFDLISTRRPDPQMLDHCIDGSLEALLDELRADYDTVIVDTGPTGFVADTLALAKSADAVLMLVKQESTTKAAAIESARRLHDAGARGLVLAMTMANPKDLELAGGRYGYVYGG